MSLVTKRIMLEAPLHPHQDFLEEIALCSVLSNLPLMKRVYRIILLAQSMLTSRPRGLLERILVSISLNTAT